MYSGESGRRTRRVPPSPSGPASRLNRARNADWLPLVTVTLRSLTSQPCSRRQEPRERAGEAPIPRRPVIVPDRPLERAVALHERLHAYPEDHLCGRDVARVPAAEIDDPAARSHRLAEVVHEQARPRLSRQPPAECRKLHVRADVGLMFMPPRYHAVISSSSGVAPIQWTVKGLGFMQLPGSSSRRRWGIADPGPGDDDAGDTIPR